MNRTNLIKACLQAVDARSYLEVGVSKGQNFLQIECGKKLAVDPKFRFDWRNAAAADPTATFYEVTSDHFFHAHAPLHGSFDVIFLDGLHTVEQTLRDFANAINVLSPNGVIIIDDVVPDSYLSSLRSQNETNDTKARLGMPDRGWMGDVYRLVPFIQTFFQQYRYALPQESGKCLVVWKSPRSAEEIVDRTLEEVGRFPFERTVLEREFYNERSISDIIQLVTASSMGHVE